jgi:hypothetical protein
MRGSVAAIAALAALALTAPANALSGPMPSSKLQNLAPSMWSRSSSSGVAAPLRAVRAVAWLPSDALPWSVLRGTARVSGPVMAPAMYVPPTAGAQAVRSRPARRLALSRPERQQHGPVRRPLRVTAGITPIPAGPKAFGTSAHKQD